MEIEHTTTQTTGPAIDSVHLEHLCRSLLDAIGEDRTRPGLIETPRRWASFWQEFLQPDDNRSTSFESVSVDQMVVVRRHGLLPAGAFPSIDPSS